MEDPKQGKAARELFANAKILLGQIIENRHLRANAVYGFFRANSDVDDIVFFREDGKNELARFCTLRQQRILSDDKPTYALADFVAPLSSGREDYVGAFAVTSGLGIEELVARFEREQDDYHVILAKALADRLAEAFAEKLHEQVRNEWGLGIRPAVGYPVWPDHSDKKILFELLKVPERANIQLTENFAMRPAASVSGFFLSHPESRYFSVGPIGRDQLANYAKRKGIGVSEAQRWLQNNIS
ncbi:MAG: vitamin B12 dependent-methionine synthase activation domain-containing protein [Pseudomonadota bacterium]